MSIGVVGSGFSGSLLAVHLLRRLPEGSRVVLVERRADFGKGLAYSTASPTHLLNVRAERMSAFEDQPDHFVRWLAARGLETDGAFVPRKLFGEYVQSLLGTQLWEPEGNQNLFLYPDEAVALSVEADGATLLMAGERPVPVTAVVLAVGNFPPVAPPMDQAVAESPRFLADPWEEDAIARIPASASVLVIGSGLTMVDFVLSLDECGHHGPVTALSRHGLLPQRHKPIVPPIAWEDPEHLPAKAGQLLTLVRRRVREEATRGKDWRQVIDGLRPHVNQLWDSFDTRERRRFLRHLRPWWDIHRHRLAPKVADRIAADMAAKRLVVRPGHILGIEAGAENLDVTWRPRGGSALEHLYGGYVVNCAGPASDFRRIRQPLLRSLLDNGQIGPDALRLGLDVTGDFRVIDREGRPSDRLFAIGPITRGRFWEVTAVPELRRQCETLAENLASRFGNG